MLDINLQEISPNLIHLQFKNQFELTSSLLRFSEFVETPFTKIRGKFFTHEQFMQLYSESQEDNKFSYFTDWSGFNIKGETFRKVKRLFKNKLWDREEQVLDMLSPWLLKRKKFYVIGTSLDKIRKDDSLLKHEIAHALTYLNKEYEIEQELNLDNLEHNYPKVYHQIIDSLSNKGYGTEVLRDEVQAYLSTSSNHLLTRLFLNSYKVINKNKLNQPFIKTLEKFI